MPSHCVPSTHVQVLQSIFSTWERETHELMGRASWKLVLFDNLSRYTSTPKAHIRSNLRRITILQASQTPLLFSPRNYPIVSAKIRMTGSCEKWDMLTPKRPSRTVLRSWGRKSRTAVATVLIHWLLAHCAYLRDGNRLLFAAGCFEK